MLQPISKDFRKSMKSKGVGKGYGGRGRPAGSKFPCHPLDFMKINEIH